MIFFGGGYFSGLSNRIKRKIFGHWRLETGASLGSALFASYPFGCLQTKMGSLNAIFSMESLMIFMISGINVPAEWYKEVGILCFVHSSS